MKRTRSRQFLERLTAWRQLSFWCQYPIIDSAVFQYADSLRKLCEMMTGAEPMKKEVDPWPRKTN